MEIFRIGNVQNSGQLGIFTTNGSASEYLKHVAFAWCSIGRDVPVIEALPGVLGIQGEGLFIFRDLGRRSIYFQRFGEKA